MNALAMLSDCAILLNQGFDAHYGKNSNLVQTLYNLMPQKLFKMFGFSRQKVDFDYPISIKIIFFFLAKIQIF